MNYRINKILNRKIIRYLFTGALTTLVNLGVFYGLKYIFSVQRDVSNIIAVFTAILFAYVANKHFVFQSRGLGWKQTFHEFWSFLCSRLFSMLVEVFGFIFLVESLSIQEDMAKLVLQFIVFLMNYLFSRYLIFRQHKAAPP